MATRGKLGSLLGTAALVGAGAATLYAVSAVAIGNFFVQYALVPGKDGKTARINQPDREGGDPLYDGFPPEERAEIRVRVAAVDQTRDTWEGSALIERVSIESFDGEAELVGFVYPAHKPTSAWVFLVHGYTGDHTEMYRYAAFYAEQGFNVFAPDLRCQGESTGKFIGMGWTDRLDVLAWLSYLIERFGADIEVVLHGHSMGGATVCMTSGEEALPAQVAAVVSDCAFASVWDMFAEQLQSLFKLPPHPVLDDAALMLKLRGGYDLKQASAIDQVAKSKTPTLFIHGNKDDFVPVSMVYELYHACSAPEKHLLIVEGAGHVRSVQVDPEQYFKTVFMFLDDKLTKPLR